MDTIRVYIVRHGETEENKQKIVQGHLDTPLNSEGERQSDIVASALKDVPFDVCYSSDLRRAVDTAKRILVYHPGVELQTQEAVRERYLGIFQGHVWGTGKALLHLENGEKRGEADEPESPEAVKKRALAWWNETIAGATASCVLIVSHAAWIRLLVQGLLEDKAIRAALRVRVARCLNTGVSIVEMQRDSGRGKLLQYGNVDHLRETAGVVVVEGNADERGIQ